MTPEAPRVSIALPVYNGEPFLVQTLADLRAQTFPHWEAVICDNASTDETQSIVQAAAAEDSRIRYVRNDRNIGALPNTNRALSMGSAPLANLWGHDDRHHPEFLATLCAAMDSHPSAALAYSDSTLCGEDERPFYWDRVHRRFVDARGHVYEYDRGLERTPPEDAIRRFQAVLEVNDINAPIHGVFRREVVQRVGAMDIHGSDRLFVAHAALLGEFVHVPEPLFGYRMHTRSTYFLDTDEWIERETGGDKGTRSGVRTLLRYMALPLAFGPSASLKMKGAGAVVRYGFMRVQPGSQKSPPPHRVEHASRSSHERRSEWVWLEMNALP